jgi:general secretion pathway protein F
MIELPTPRAGVPAASPAPTPAARAAFHVDEEQFAHDLSLMLRSGLSLIEALRTLSEQGAGSAAAPVRELLQLLQRGESLSRAMQATGAFGVPLLACAKASELTGDLGDSLQRFAANAARIRVLRSRLVSACVYPALLIGVDLRRRALPARLRGAALRAGARQRGAGHRTAVARADPPRQGDARGPAADLADAGRSRRRAGLDALAPGARRPARRAGCCSRPCACPGCGPTCAAFGLSQLARSGAMLIRSGVPALKALAMCRELVAPSDQPRLDRALAAASTGTPLAQSLHDAGLLDTLAWRVLRVAEETGQLHAALDRVADVHDALLERGLERLGRLIEPILMLTIGVVVGGIVVLMYVPIFQMASSIR